MINLKTEHSGDINISKNGSGPKIFYGWWIVLAGTIIFIVSSGIGYYGHGVFLDPLQAKFGWSKGIISSAVTLYFIINGWAGFFVGRFIDKYGPRPVLITGALVVGLSLLLLSRITEIWQLYAVYILMALGWSCTSLIPLSTLITRWFIKRRGLAMGITMTGLSLGGIIIVPLATYMIYAWSLKAALPVLGLIFCVVIIPLALFIIKKQPSDINQYPDGIHPDNTKKVDAQPDQIDMQMIYWTRRNVMGTLPFWAIVISFLFALTGQNAYLIHQISFLSKYLGAPGAATAVSITAGASIIGRLSLSSVIDRFDKRTVTMFLFILQSLAVLSLAYTDHIIVLYIGTFIFGLTMGNILMMLSLIIGECFGLISFATIYGTATLFISSGSAMGPAIAGFIFDQTESYQTAFTIFAAMSILASITIHFARVPKKYPHG